MDDLDRRSVDVAIGILQAETESPGSQKTASIEIAKQILAQLRPAELHLREISGGSELQRSPSAVLINLPQRQRSLRQAYDYSAGHIVKSIDELRDDYVAAIDARVRADGNLKGILVRLRMSGGNLAELKAAVQADIEAEKQLDIARNAYQAAA